jgi:hypothetical protein
MQLGDGGFRVPGLPNRPVPPKDSSGNAFSGGVPIFESPGKVTEKPLEYFERQGEYELPKFKYEEVYDTLSDKLEQKIPMGFLDKFKNASSGSFQLKFKVDFMLPEPFDVRVGPWEVNIGEYIQNFADSNFGKIIRLILLCLVCLFFFVSVLGLIFS